MNESKTLDLDLQRGEMAHDVSARSFVSPKRKKQKSQNSMCKSKISFQQIALLHC